MILEKIIFTDRHSPLWELNVNVRNTGKRSRPNCSKILNVFFSLNKHEITRKSKSPLFIYLIAVSPYSCGVQPSGTVHRPYSAQGWSPGVVQCTSSPLHTRCVHVPTWPHPLGVAMEWPLHAGVIEHTGPHHPTHEAPQTSKNMAAREAINTATTPPLPNFQTQEETHRSDDMAFQTESCLQTGDWASLLYSDVLDQVSSVAELLIISANKLNFWNMGYIFSIGLSNFIIIVQQFHCNRSPNEVIS